MVSPLLQRVDKLLEARRLILSGLEPMLEDLKNKDIPLSNRWSAYTLLVANHIITREQSYGDGYLDDLGGDLTQYDHFNNGRHNTVRFIDMYDRIVDADPRWQSDLSQLQGTDNFVAWQERVLASGYASFTYDW